MFSFFLLLSISGVLVSVFAGGVAFALAETNAIEKSENASDAWLNLKLRNGVTEPLPWHPPTHTINRPGMVELKPVSLRDPVGPVPVEPPPVASDLEANQPKNQGSERSELVDEPELEPLELADPPVAGEKARVIRLHKKGLSQTAIIKAVWGIPRGGSKRYKKARSRYLEYTTPAEEIVNA